MVGLQWVYGWVSSDLVALSINYEVSLNYTSAVDREICCGTVASHVSLQALHQGELSRRSLCVVLDPLCKSVRARSVSYQAIPRSCPFHAQPQYSSKAIGRRPPWPVPFSTLWHSILRRLSLRLCCPSCVVSTLRLSAVGSTSTTYHGGHPE